MTRKYKGETVKRFCDLCGDCVETTKPAKDKNGAKIVDFVLFGQPVYRSTLIKGKEWRRLVFYTDDGAERGRVICCDCAAAAGVKFGATDTAILDKRTSRKA